MEREEPMPTLTPEGHEVVRRLAARHAVSEGAVVAVLEALVRGRGTIAQFDHPELGGAGQWMRGGMTQVGDMFNTTLQAKVSALCSELAPFASREPASPAPFGAQRRSQRSTPAEPTDATIFTSDHRLFEHPPS